MMRSYRQDLFLDKHTRTQCHWAARHEHFQCIRPTLVWSVRIMRGFSSSTPKRKWVVQTSGRRAGHRNARQAIQPAEPRLLIIPKIGSHPMPFGHLDIQWQVAIE